MISETAFPQVAALRDVSCVTEALHQRRPRLGDADGIPSRRRRLAREAVARQRRNHEVERVGCAPAVRRGIGERIDDLELLDDRAWPSMRDDHRQRVLVLRADVDEVNVEPIDLGYELREGVQFRFALAPLVVLRPVARKFLRRRKLHALRGIRDGFPIRPSCGVDAPAQFGQIRFGNVQTRKGTKSRLIGFQLVCNSRHGA